MEKLFVLGFMFYVWCAVKSNDIIRYHYNLKLDDLYDLYIINDPDESIKNEIDKIEECLDSTFTASALWPYQITKLIIEVLKK